LLKYIRTRAVWLAVGIVLGGSALSFAGVTATSSHSPKPHPSVSASDEPTDVNESPEPKESESDQNSGTNDQRPENHGFFVSQAAQCIDVTADVPDVTFPADCATNGQAHGAYVKSVAQSDAGKGDHGNANSHSQSTK
jgi:hypothetical protein